MTPLELLHIMRMAAITDTTEIKTDWLEMKRSILPNCDPSSSVTAKEETPTPQPEPTKPETEPELTPQEEKELRVKLANMESVMQLGDVELLERLFPPELNPEDE